MASTKRTPTSSSMKTVPLEIQRLGASAVSLYERLLSEGYSHKWAEMCATQQPPGLRGTDRTFMEKRSNQEWLDDMPRDQALRILREAKSAGINTSGKFYMSGIADKRGHKDPAAWVDSVADVKKVAAQRNLTVRGAVEHQGIPVPPPPPKPLSDRLTREMMAYERKKNPALKSKKDGEIREMVVAKYGRNKRK